MASGIYDDIMHLQTNVVTVAPSMPAFSTLMGRVRQLEEQVSLLVASQRMSQVSLLVAQQRSEPVEPTKDHGAGAKSLVRAEPPDTTQSAPAPAPLTDMTSPLPPPPPSPSGHLGPSPIASTATIEPITVEAEQTGPTDNDECGAEDGSLDRVRQPTPGTSTPQSRLSLVTLDYSSHGTSPLPSPLESSLPPLTMSTIADPQGESSHHFSYDNADRIVR